MERREKALERLHEGTVIPAIPLALDASRRFSEKWQRLLIRYYLDAGAGGIAVGVHTTQFAIREPRYNLFERVLAVVADEMARYEAESGRTVVKVCGACGPVEQALSEAGIAKKLGYDAVLLSPSGLSTYRETDMLSRTRAVAAVMPVIGFYLQPSAGGRLFTYDYWRQLCEIEGVVAIKCAPFNRYQTLDVVRAVALSSRADAITLYTGNDDNIVLDLLTEYRFTVDGATRAKRFRGGLLGHWAVWTHSAVALFNRLREAAGAPDPELLTLAMEVTDMNAVLFDAANGFAGCIPGIHEVLRRQGLMEGIWCLNPEETLSPGQAEALDRIQRAYPHLTDDDFVRARLSAWKRAVGL